MEFADRYIMPQDGRYNRAEWTVASLKAINLFALGFAALTATGCSGSSLPLAASNEVSTADAHTATVVLKLIVPSNVAAAVHTRQARSASRITQYVSSSTTSLSVVLHPAGSQAQRTLLFPCTTASCTASFAAPTGSDSIALSLMDATGTSLSITGGTPIYVLPNTTNAFNLTANPVVGSVAVMLGSTPVNAATTNGGTAGDFPVTVQAFDADHNLIVGPGSYVDANNNPVTLTLSVANTQAGGNGAVTLTGPTTISAPGALSITAHYNGGWLDHATIGLATTSALIASVSAATLTTKPYAVEYSAPGGPFGITAGPDGNIWYAESGAGVNKIGRMSTSGTNYVAYGCGACTAPYYIVIGPDQNLWFTEATGNYIDKITTSGVATRVVATPVFPLQIVSGPDGDLWFSALNGDVVGKVTTTGSITNYPAGGGIQAVGNGPDGNLWYINQTTGILGKMSTSGSILASYAISGWVAGNNPSQGLVTGPDGNVWFTDAKSNSIQQVTASGTFTSHSLQNNAGPRDIVAGPDGALWFTEPSTNSIGRLTTSGVLTEYGLNNGINAASTPIGIAVGPDGNIWFAENGSNTIGKFVL